MDTTNQIPQRAPALVALIGIIAGLILSRYVTIAASIGLLLAIVFGALSLLSAIIDRQKLWLATFIFATALGFWTYGSIRLPFKIDRDCELPPREAELVLEIERVMQAENSFGKATGIAHVLEASSTSRLSKRNRVYFRLSKEDTSALNIGRGMQIRTKGVLSPVKVDEGGESFGRYLQSIGVNHRFERTSATEALKETPIFFNLCRSVNQRFQDYLRLGEPGERDLSRIYIAMILGLKTELTSEQEDRFRMTGTMHLFAISGLHIGVVAAVIAQTLLMIRLPTSVRPFIGLPLLYFYVEITGAAPSAVRAFLMVTFFWLGLGLRRQRSPLAALAASAIFVLVIQPGQLWQMGFQLSYLVVLSILLFGLPLYASLWQRIRPYKYLPESDWTPFQKATSWLGDRAVMLLAISLSAWLASAPLSAGFFGYIAPYAIFVNMLLVNLAALVISTGVISLSLATIGWHGMTAFLNHAAWLGISMMDGLIQLNLGIPGAIIECSGFPKLISYMSVLSYFSLIFLTTIKTKTRPMLRFLLPGAIVLASLLCGMSFL